MKNSFRKLTAYVFVFILLFLTTIPVLAEQTTVDDSSEIIDGIVAFNLEKASAQNINEWVNNDLAKNISSGGEWYVLALSQNAKYNFSSYETALIKYLKNNRVSSASSRLKYALTLSAIGSTDSYIYTALNGSIGKQGIMSYVYGLHLMNNGYSSNQITKTAVIDKILSLQLSDGGFAIYGDYGDVDVTAMTIQALAVFYKSNNLVKTAVDKAVEFLSNSQNEDGTFKSYGVKNPESGAQVIVALTALNINPLTDSRFIKNNSTIIDGIKLFMLKDKSFSHTIGGEYNSNATTQVFYSLVAFNRLKQSKSAFYILDNANPKALQIPTTSTDTTTNANTSSKVISNNINSVDSTVSANEENEKNNNEVINSSTQSSEITQSSNQTTTTSKSKLNTKVIIAIVVIVLAAIVCVLLFVFKKRKIKNYLYVLVVSGIIIALTFILNLQTPEEFYNANQTQKENVIGSVTITVNCNTIKDKVNKPEIIPQTECLITKGDTVYDVLFEVLTANQIPFETSGVTDNVYLEGINNIYEFSYGELSGWLYFVNGQSPPKSMSQCEVNPNDKIEVLYTTNMGEDLK